MLTSLGRILNTSPHVGGVVDFVIYSALVLAGISWANAHVISFIFSIPWYFFAAEQVREIFLLRGIAKYTRIGVLVCFLLIVIAIRAAFIAGLHTLVGIHLVLCFIPALLIGLFSREIYVRIQERITDKNSVELFIFYGALTALVLKPFYFGALELIPEEAYYWLYTVHPSPGYLDHPPFVGWMIGVGTSIFGTNEFGVRSFCLIISILTAWIVYHFSKKLFGEEGAVNAASLSLLLPYFWGTGFFVSPDLGLILFWSLSLLLIWRALNGENSKNWLLVGAVIGFGMLSKYTIVLLALPTFAAVCLIPDWKRWLKDPYFYAAPIASFVVFSPVLYWNATHGWASFAFQSTRRLESSVSFSLHSLLFDTMCLVTPTALVIAILVISKKISSVRSLLKNKAEFFSIVFFLLPFSVFAIYSLRHVPKLNWTGPSFIALLPLVSRFGISAAKSSSQFSILVYRSWVFVISIWICIICFTFHYLGFGFPFIPYSQGMHRVIGWRSLADAVLDINNRIEVETGKKAVLVGMDKHNIAAELWFYAVKKRASEAPLVASRNILGEEALMFKYWSPPENFLGSTMILVARSGEDISNQKLTGFFGELGQIQQFELFTGWSRTKAYYYRIGYGYKGVKPNNDAKEIPVIPNQSPPAVNQS